MVDFRGRFRPFWAQTRQDEEVDPEKHSGAVLSKFLPPFLVPNDFKYCAVTQDMTPVYWWYT